jgi:hypothetical protein
VPGCCGFRGRPPQSSRSLRNPAHSAPVTPPPPFVNKTSGSSWGRKVVPPQKTWFPTTSPLCTLLILLVEIARPPFRRCGVKMSMLIRPRRLTRIESVRHHFYPVRLGLSCTKQVQPVSRTRPRTAYKPRRCLSVVTRAAFPGRINAAARTRKRRPNANRERRVEENPPASFYLQTWVLLKMRKGRPSSGLGHTPFAQDFFDSGIR